MSDVEPVEQALQQMEQRLDRFAAAASAAHQRTDEAIEFIELRTEELLRDRGPWAPERRELRDLMTLLRSRHDDELHLARSVTAYDVLDPLRIAIKDLL